MNPSELERLLTLLDQWDGSDLHLKAGAPPRMRINGELRTLVDELPLNPENTAAIAAGIAPPRGAGDIHRDPGRPGGCGFSTRPGRPGEPRGTRSPRGHLRARRRAAGPRRRYRADRLGED